MKKVMIVFAMSAMIMTIATVKAEGAKENKSAKDMDKSFVVEDARVNADSVIYKFHIRLRDMNKAMHLDIEQIEHLQITNKELSRRIARLENASADERQAKLAAILADNLAEVHQIVDEAQYRAYLTLINNEFNKTGLNNILYGYNSLAEK